MRQPQRIRSARIVLRPLTEMDDRLMFGIFRDWESRPIGYANAQRAVELALNEMDAGTGHHWIAQSPAGVEVGAASVSFPTARSAVVDRVGVHPRHRGNGHWRAISNALQAHYLDGGHVDDVAFAVLPGAAAIHADAAEQGYHELDRVPGETGLELVRMSYSAADRIAVKARLAKIVDTVTVET